MAVGGLSTLVTQAACACCRTLADKMGLERVRLGSDGDQVTIWDGHSFVFNQSSWSVVNLYRMVRRRAASPRSGTDLTASYTLVLFLTWAGKCRTVLSIVPT